MYGGSMIQYMNNEGFKSGLARPTVSQQPAQTGPQTRWEKAGLGFRGVSNCRCRKLVERKVPFQANNIFARLLFPAVQWTGGTDFRTPLLYVVYSYGLHFPLYVFDFAADRWYGNTDKYSQSTSKHMSQTRPYGGPVIEGKTTDELQDLISSKE